MSNSQRVLYGNRLLCKYHIEPIADIQTRKTVGYEILCRSQPYPETTDEWRTWAAYLTDIANDIAVPGTFAAINMDSQQLHDPVIADTLSALNKNIVIEWTEKPGEQPIEDTAAILQKLRNKQGIRIAIDDAGAGADGIQRIMATHPDFVKIDGKLIQAATIHRDPLAFAGIEAIAHIAKMAGATLVAEWVESEREWEICRQYGIHMVQGFYVQETCGKQRRI